MAKMHAVTDRPATPADDNVPRKMRFKRKMSTLRKAIRAVFRPSKVPPVDGPPPQVTPERSENGESSSSSTASSSKSLNTSGLASSVSTGNLTASDSSPVKSSSAPDVRAPTRPATKSGFYRYMDHPSYLGSRLFQPGDLKPELDIN